MRRSTKGGASPSPTPAVAAGHRVDDLAALNEGWGFALTYTRRSSAAERSSCNAQRRVGLRPHLHSLVIFGSHFFEQSLNEGWGFALTYTPPEDAGVSQGSVRSTKGGASPSPTLFRLIK